MFKIGPVEYAIYCERAKYPIVIPQVDPSVLSISRTNDLIQLMKKLGLKFLAVGGSIVDSRELQRIVYLCAKENIYSLVYPSDGSVLNTTGVRGKSALYWMNIPNSENQYFSKDMLIQNALSAVKSGYELIPTTYVFDARESNSAALWVTKANPIPREKPYLSLSVALSAQFSGSRFYIMAGGSGCKLLPPSDHIKLLRKETDLFLIPTSGIRTAEDAHKMFTSGADAIHVGHILEGPGGLNALSSLVSVSKSFGGRSFI